MQSQYASLQELELKIISQEKELAEKDVSPSGKMSRSEDPSGEN
jgi:hypothetical protein